MTVCDKVCLGVASISSPSPDVSQSSLVATLWGGDL